MLPRESLQRAIVAQREELGAVDGLVPRELLGELEAFKYGGAKIVKGVRRCGKSTLLKQLMRRKFVERFFYADFDDERLFGFSVQDFEPLMQVFMEQYGNCKAVLFDEIQNVGGWELFVNRLLRSGYSVYVTGSNADLLSKELGTHLTGRHYDFSLYPFSFKEFCLLRKVATPKAQTTAESAALQKTFDEYLTLGGMPEAALAGNTKVLSPLLEDVIRKDIIQRYNVRKPNELKAVLRFVIGNASNRITFNSLAGNFKIASPNTVQKYFEYASEAFLVFSVSKYDRKIRRFDKNPRKAYCVDNGIVSEFSAGIAQQQGALLENLAAVELRRRKQAFFYYENRNGSETDFLVVSGEGLDKRPRAALQACLGVSDPLTAKREENALLDTLEETRLKEGLILTIAHSQTKKFGNKTITYKPAWKWLIET